MKVHSRDATTGDPTTTTLTTGFQAAVSGGFERCENTSNTATDSRRIKLYRTESFTALSPPDARERVHGLSDGYDAFEW